MHVAQDLANEVSSRRGLQVTMVTDQSHFLFTPLWTGVAGGTSRLTQVAMPVRSLLDDDVRVELAEVQHIDLAARRVHAGRLTVDYDFLVLATGATTNWGAHAEFEAHALPCRTGRDAVDAYDAVDRAFERAAQITDPAERRRALTFVIVGAGATGVELIARIASRFEAQRGRELDAALVSQSRLVLIERRDRVLPDLDEAMSDHAREHLRGAGIEVRLGEAVVACTAERVELSTQDAIGCGTIFWCGGVRSPAWLTDVGFETEASGRIVVHRTLQAVGQHGVYIAGDLASTGEHVPLNADAATQQARTVARNIIADLSGRSRKDWTYEPSGTFITLGRSNAVASYRGMILVGRTAQALSAAMTARLLPQGVRGLTLVPDLFAGAFAARSSAATQGLLTE